MPQISKVPAIPAPTVPLLNPDGTMRREWYQYFAAKDRADRQVSAAVEVL